MLLYTFALYSSITGLSVSMALISYEGDQPAFVTKYFNSIFVVTVASTETRIETSPRE